MFGLILICFIVYIGAYFCLKASGDQMEVGQIRTFDDYFIDSNERTK